MGKKWHSVVALDPGGTTGVAWACFPKSDLKEPGGWRYALGEAKVMGRLETFEVVEADENEHVLLLVKLLMQLGEMVSVASAGRLSSHTQLVVEDFILRERTKDRTLLAPVRIWEKLDFALRLESDLVQGVTMQQPSQAKAVVTNERLKRWGFWVVGSTHKRDAMRHLVSYVRGL